MLKQKSIVSSAFFASLACYVSAGFEKSMRSLIFPPGIGNKIQFLTGFGIPVSDLPEPYSITYGYVIKTSIDILNNVSVFHDPYVEYQKSHQPSRWDIYELIQKVIDGLGYNGRECLLRLICETASTLFVKDNLVSEILHVLLTPSFTKDWTPVSLQEKEFYKAEQLGRTKLKTCFYHFRKCKLSLLDMFSEVAYESREHFLYNM
ncbi:unnamed protein product [Bemisia tabaci]|uniref:Uncharacterized protein n=1 Tax=Bemisia tabaci TaxID=7038 RepID=A0A9P0A0F2_BEMTA|nr:PREDICTED: uncharacterized protein LOC109039496 [Bemisia tabaci]CAH0381625.1 unnamed protein product [Bemisia tabaci]